MSLLKIFGVGGECAAKALGPNSAVATKLVRSGEAVVDMAKDLLKSPAVDEFISKAPKGSDIIGDNIIRFDGSLPMRVVTKRLWNGSVVSKGFYPGDTSAYFTEILTKDGVRAYNGCGTSVVIKPNSKNTVAMYGKAEHTAGLPDVSKTLAAKAVGLTERANVDNVLYQQLKVAGMLPRSC